MSNKVTLLPEYIDIIQQPSISFYKTATNLLDAFSTYTGQLETAINFEKSKVSDDVIKSASDLYKTLNSSGFKVKVDKTDYEFDNVFKLFYIEKFQSLTDNIKELLTSSFSGENIFFTDFSDDVGNITDIVSIIDDSTVPYYDIHDKTFTYPNNIPASMYNKVSKNELSTSIELNVLTDAILKTSLSGLVNYSDDNIAQTSHGKNLVTDSLYVRRVRTYSDTISSQLKNIIGDMSDFIYFFKRVNYRAVDEDRNAKFLKYKSDVEAVEVKIDALKNKLDKSIPTTLVVTQSSEDALPKTPASDVETSIV